MGVYITLPLLQLRGKKEINFADCGSYHIFQLRKNLLREI